MTHSPIRTALAHALDSAQGHLDFVITDAPSDFQALTRVFDDALALACQHRIPLRSIAVNMNAYPDLGDAYWHVEITPHPTPGVVRLRFQNETPSP